MAGRRTEERLEAQSARDRRRTFGVLAGSGLFVVLVAVLIGHLIWEAVVPPVALVNGASGFSTPGVPTCADAASAPNPIIAENQCQGTRDWREDRPLGSDHAIEGFAAPASVNVGERVRFFISTTASNYAFRVYRVGWYGGDGARLMYTSPVLSGVKQPAPLYNPATRMASCSNWTHPQSLTIPMNWVSGQYIVKLITSQGFMRYIPFVVRDDQSHAPILVQTSVLTYQAYNTWGEHSLYVGRPGDTGDAVHADRAYVVSFDRPYRSYAGLMHFALYEYDTVRWLEREGFDATYATDIDTDLRGQLLLQHRLILFAGHDEYWSMTMRHNVTAARDAGVSLAFFAANNMYWQVRLQPSPLGLDREVICYKDATLDPFAISDPKETTVQWRAAPVDMPEREVIGEQYAAIVAPHTAPLVLGPGAKPFLEGTGLRPGSSLPGLIGGEVDSVGMPKVRRALTVLATSPVLCDPGYCRPLGIGAAMAIMYTMPSGAHVFDAGTFFWAWGLDDDRMIAQVPVHTALASPGFGLFNAHLLAYLMGGQKK
jgi:hypothetical protein